MIVYEVIDGFAHRLRYEEDDYALRVGELSIAGFGELPPLESLHDPLAVRARQNAEEGAQALLAELVNLLRTASPSGITAYVDNNVLDLASARTMLKRIILVLANRG
jgi:hypothetical protein